MDRGLYIAASGMLAELTRQDQIANDLANASTPGYKADRSAQASFGELMLANRSNGQTVGPLSLGAHIAEIRTDVAPTALRQTDEPTRPQPPRTRTVLPDISMYFGGGVGGRSVRRGHHGMGPSWRHRKRRAGIGGADAAARPRRKRM